MASRCRGIATQQTLNVFEEAILRGPRKAWLHLVPFAGHGGRRGFGGKTNVWIRCRFSNGQNVDLRTLPGGKYFVQGEDGFLLDLSEQAVETLESPAAWEDFLATEVPSPQITDNHWIGRNITFGDLTLDQSPLLNNEWEILEIVSAERYSIRPCPCSEGESGPSIPGGTIGPS